MDDLDDLYHVIKLFQFYFTRSGSVLQFLYFNFTYRKFGCIESSGFNGFNGFNGETLYIEATEACY